jgi:hypothetical protein
MKSILRIAFADFMCLILNCSLSAQNDVSRSLGLEIGVINMHLRDKLASEMIFSHTGMAPSVQYDVSREKSRQFAEGSFYFNTLNTTPDNFTIHDFSGRFRYAYLHNLFDLKLSGNDLSFRAGGSFTSFFNKSDYDFQLQTGTARALSTWYWSHSIDLAIQVEYKFTRGDFLSLQAYFPVISNVSRPTYSSSGDYNYDLNKRIISVLGITSVLSENVALNTLLIFQHPLSEKFDIQFGYEFLLAKYENPMEMSLYTNNFSIALKYFFGRRSGI